MICLQSRYSDACNMISHFVKLQELIHETPIIDENAGRFYLVDSEKFDELNQKFIEELKELMRLNAIKWNAYQKKTLADFFLFIKDKQTESYVFDFSDKDESWKSPGSKRVG